MAKRRNLKSTKKQSGGYLIGPSHEEGGILARTPGMPDVELEGGEYIINAATTEALGTEFLDILNRTASPYHSQPGFNRGQLPGSRYKGGGKIKKLQYGGRSNQGNQQTSNELPLSYRKTNIPGRICKNCLFFKANFCNKWNNNVNKNYICESWNGSLQTRVRGTGGIL